MLRSLPLVLLTSLVALLPLTVTSAQELPLLAAIPYPGAIPGNIENGKPAACGWGEDHHDAFCFLTRDPVEKVQAFYAEQGIQLAAIPVKKDQNAESDGLYDLEEAVRLQLPRESIGILLAGPVEYVETQSADDEPSYFNAVIVMTGKPGPKLQGNQDADTAILTEDPIFKRFVMLPALAELMEESMELVVDAEKLFPLYNQHHGMYGSFFQMVDAASTADLQLDELNKRRATEFFEASDNAFMLTTENRTKAIASYLAGLEKEAYPTCILIQRAGGSGVKQDAATVQKEWSNVVQ